MTLVLVHTYSRRKPTNPRNSSEHRLLYRHASALTRINGRHLRCRALGRTPIRGRISEGHHKRRKHTVVHHTVDNCVWLRT